MTLRVVRCKLSAMKWKASGPAGRWICRCVDARVSPAGRWVEPLCKL